MTDSRARAVFFPYLYTDDTLRIDLSGCELDGKSFNARWNSESMECDLSGAEPWSSGLLRFAIAREPKAIWVPDLVPPSERGKPPVRLVGTAHCGATFYRRACAGSLDVKGESGTLEVPLARKSLAGALDVDVFVVRKSAQSVDPQLASDAAARIIASGRITVRIDSPTRRPGPGLNIEWESFKASKHPYRAAHSGALFHLDTAGPEPILFLNKDADPDLHAILTEEAPRGKKAALRNVLFAAIAFPVWTCLVRTALAAVDDEGKVPDGWQRNVLVELAAIGEPNCDREEAMRRFIRDLRDPAGGHGIDERLPVIIAELVSFRKKAEESAGVLL